MQANNDTWQAHNETMQVLQNKTLAALDGNTNALKSLGHHQQSSFLERTVLLTPSSDPTVTLKDDGGKTFAVENDMVDILIELSKQTNKRFQLISVDPNSNKFKINVVDVSPVPDGIQMKVKVYDFSKGFAMYITRNGVTESDIKVMKSK